VQVRLGASGALAGLAILVALAVERHGRARAELRPDPAPGVERRAIEVELWLRVARDVPADPPAPRWVSVSGDVPAWVASSREPSSEVVIYLHGMCGDPARAAELAPAVQRRATLIAPRADSACHGAVGHYWAGDATFLDYRIRKAIRSVGQRLDRPLDEAEIVLVGYSQGAQRAEELAHVYPRRYARVVLMSGPSPPSFARVRSLRAPSRAVAEKFEHPTARRLPRSPPLGCRPSSSCYLAQHTGSSVPMHRG
jgi:predicted esterase